MSEPDLARVQALFFQAIRWPKGCRDFLEQTDPSTRELFERVFASTPALSSTDRLEIYADSYFYRLKGALEELFPRLAKLMGEAVFHNFVTDYVWRLPSSQPDLRCIGDRLPAYLAEHSVGQQFPQWVELARVESALSHSLDAPGAQPLTESALAKVAPDAWPGLRFGLCPPTRLLECRFRFEDTLRGESPAFSGLSPAQPSSPASRAQLVLVGRSGHAPYARTLEPPEAAALGALARGETFEQACESAQALGVGPAGVVQWLRNWVKKGVLSSRFES